MAIQTLSVDWPFNEDAPVVHCPACGTQVLRPNDAVEQPACNHVKFVYFGEIDDFDYVAPDIESQIAAKQEADDDLTKGDVLEALDGPSTCFIYELTTSGMACGPVSSTIRVGFDLAASVEGSSNG